MDLFSTYAPIVHQLATAVAGTEIVYRSRQDVEGTTITALVLRGAEFERANPGLYCSATFLLSEVANAPTAGDEVDITAANAVCQVVKDGIALDGYGGVTVHARLARPLVP